MQDYFPIIVDKTPGKVVEGSGNPDGPLDMLFIDRNGEKKEPEIVNAVLNGVEIDT